VVARQPTVPNGASFVYLIDQENRPLPVQVSRKHGLKFLLLR
jgi:hypothetical protein